MGHLGCFAGGNMMLGGRYLGREDVVALGVELVESCRAVYDATSTGIGPEMWTWKASKRHRAFAPTDPDHQKQAAKLGWWTIDGRYLLRPGGFG